MTARPDVPDTPDRTDAIARTLREFAWINESEARDIVNLLLTRADPAAVAALAATLAERHPDALLDALTNAGVLEEEWRLIKDYRRVNERRLVTVWREVQQP